MIRTILNRTIKQKSKITTLGYALLGLIHQNPSTGYDLRKIFMSTPMGHYSSSPGAIYPALRRLEEQGFVTGRIDRSKSLRPKQVFQLTKSGTKALREWLAREIVSEDVIWNLDELMLRFAFHSILGSDSASREFLTTFAREADRYTAHLAAERANLPDKTPIHGLLALESGIDSYRAHARWARKALKHFEGSSK